MILLIYNYSQEVRDLFYTDSIRKKLTINLSESPINFSTYNKPYFDIYKSLSDDEIISESMEFSEALTEETKFTLRSFSCPQLSVDRVFEQKDFTGCACNCILSIYNDDNTTIAANIVLLQGYVSSDEASEDRKTRKLVCLDAVSQLLNIEIFSLSGVSKGNQTILTLMNTISSATNISFYWGKYNKYGELYVEIFNPEYNVVELSQTVDFSNFENSYTINDFLKDFAEILGAFCVFYKSNTTSLNNSYIGLEITFVPVQLNLDLLYPSTTKYPSKYLYPLFGDSVDNYAQYPIVHNLPWFKKVVISTKPVIPYKYFSVYIGNKEIFKSTTFISVDMDLEYKVSNNILCQYAVQDELIYLTARADYMASHLNYFLIKLEMPYLAYLQPGDCLLVNSEWGTYAMPIIKVDVKGINSLNATVTCELATL